MHARGRLKCISKKNSVEYRDFNESLCADSHGVWNVIINYDLRNKMCARRR